MGFVAGTLDSSISTFESLFVSSVALALASVGAPNWLLEFLVLRRLPDPALVDEVWKFAD